MIVILNLIVCDDDKKTANLIHKSISDILDNLNIEFNMKKFNDAENLKKFYLLEHDKINVIFLDIELGATTGIKVAKEIIKVDKDIQFVFFSNYQDYCFDEFINGKYRFVRKNKLKDDLALVLNTLDYECHKCITLKNIVNKNMENVKCNDITHITRNGRYLIINTLNGKYKKRCAIKEVLNELSAKKFIYVNSGVIVNLKYSKLNSDRVVIVNNKDLHTISRSRLKNVKESLLLYSKQVEI